MVVRSETCGNAAMGGQVGMQLQEARRECSYRRPEGNAAMGGQKGMQL